MRVAVALANGFEEIEGVSIIDILRRGEIEVQTFSITCDKNVIGAHNISVLADNLFEEVDFSLVQMIILPGGMPGTANLSKHEGLAKVLLDFNINNKYIGAICAAPSVLGGIGLLDKINATCYPGWEDKLYGAELRDESVVIDKNIFTSRGVGTAFQFALKIVEKFKGEEVANKLKQSMLIEK